MHAISPEQPIAGTARWQPFQRLLALAALCAGLLSWSAAAEPVAIYGYEVVRSYPHDPQAWTQGLVWRDRELYESTGLHGRSSLRRVDLESGKVLHLVPLAQEFFAEGLAIWDDRVIQLTWRSQVGFVYELDGFERIGQFTYAGEGWGLTHDGTHLIMSDGSAELRFLDPVTFAEVRRVTVAHEDRPIALLNELEYVRGEIWANVWKSDLIVRISPADGRLVGVIDLRGLLTPQERAGADVLNGIAYDEAEDRVFVTGKLWPKLFEIRLVRRG